VIADDRQFFRKRKPKIARRRQDKGRHLDDLDENLPQHQKRNEKYNRLGGVFPGKFHGPTPRRR
jgi:hypothetical protein